MQAKYQGIVRNRLGGWIVFRSRKYATKTEAIERAEKRAAELNKNDKFRYQTEVVAKFY